MADFVTEGSCNLVSVPRTLSGLTVISRLPRLCAVHNEVNAKLHKPDFDCANLDATYDCGCGDTPVSATNVAAGDLMDLEYDISKDSSTGVKMIKGGR